MKPEEISKDIFDVGIRDWTCSDFHGFATPRGVTYNSFLIMDEKVCLIDGVKALLQNASFIRSVKSSIPRRLITLS